MEMKSTVVFLLLQVVFSRPSPAIASYSHRISVDSKAGHDEHSCWNGTISCKTLNFALKGLKEPEISGNSTEVVIAPGKYRLFPENVSDESVSTFQDVSQFALTGQATGEVVVTCEYGAGFAFNNSQSIDISNIVFCGCGAKRISTSRNFANRKELEYLHFFTAFYFLFCKDVCLNRVTITHSLGIAVQLYSTVGNVTIKDCDLSFNSVNETEIAGGGGLYVEFPYCAPGDSECGSGSSNISAEFAENATYTISGCTLVNNTARVNQISNVTFTPFIPHAKDHWAFGRGGGISFFFKGSTRNVSVTVEDCTVSRNEALWGAGVFAEFQDNVTQCSFTLRRSKIIENSCYTDQTYSEGTGGGGVRLGIIFYKESYTEYSQVTNVSIELESCYIARNKAYWGGGVSFYSARETTKVVPTNTLRFTDCRWSWNEAVLGSAVDLSIWHTTTTGARIQPVFKDCTFTNNNLSSTASDIGGVVGIGTFFTDTIPVVFDGYVNFTSNLQSALAATSTSLDFLDNCLAIFVNNRGRNGAALLLNGYAYVRVHENTTMKFIGNAADYRGGAIYSESVGQHDLIASASCFIRFTDIDATPWNWTSEFHFENNSASGRNNSIYATSLLPCLFGGSYGPSTGSQQDYADKVFCWNSSQWDYGGRNCTDEIASAPANYSAKVYNVSLYSGRIAQLPVVVLDDHRQVVVEPQVYGIWGISDNLVSATPYVVGNATLMWKNTSESNNQSAIFYLETESPRIVNVKVSVTFLPCPPGFIEVVDDQYLARCQCGDGFAGLVECDSFNFSAKLQAGAWMGVTDDSPEVVAGFQPYSQGSLFVEYFDIPRNTSELDSSICNRVNREGVLCGECRDGYAPGYNTPNFACVPCSRQQSYYYWVFYLLSKFVPLTALLCVILVFRISVTSGPANSFVFFAQILLATFTLGGSNIEYVNFWEVRNGADFFRSLYITIYGITNLNFFEPLIPGLCIGRMRSLQVISFSYIVAAYPLLFLLVIFLFAHFYESGIRPIVCLCRPIHRCFARIRQRWDLQDSLIHSFTTMIVLSYAKFILVSFFFLIPTHLYNDCGETVGDGRLYFSGNVVFLSKEHIPYFVVAICVMLVFGGLPLLLLVYPLKLLKRLTTCRRWGMNPFQTGPKLLQLLDAFQGCFKDNHRYFAGVYLILRIAIFVISLSTTPQWFLQYILLNMVFMVAILLFSIVRPYKRDLFNHVDTAIFVNMALVNTLLFYVNYPSNYSREMTWPKVVLFVLVYLPLLYMVAYIVYTQIISESKWCKKVYEKLCCCFRQCCSLCSGRKTPSGSIGGHMSTNYSTIMIEDGSQDIDLAEMSMRMREQQPYWPIKDSS